MHYVLLEVMLISSREVDTDQFIAPVDARAIQTHIVQQLKEG